MRLLNLLFLGAISNSFNKKENKRSKDFSQTYSDNYDYNDRFNEGYEDEYSMVDYECNDYNYYDDFDY